MKMTRPGAGFSDATEDWNKRYMYEYAVSDGLRNFKVEHSRVSVLGKLDTIVLSMQCACYYSSGL